MSGSSFPVQFAVDTTGPQGGSLLASLISMPSTWGKMQEGGLVGTILQVIGVLARTPITCKIVPTKPPSCIFPHVLGIDIKLASNEPP